MRALVLAVLLAGSVCLLAASCGSSGRPSAKVAAHPVEKPRSHGRLKQEYVQLYADIRRIRAAAAQVDHASLMGTPALMAATGKFLDHEQRASIGLKAKNRLIDHAAGAVAGTCEQCFQMLEANRPIPQLAGH